jgi:hypothetical protein
MQQQTTHDADFSKSADSIDIEAAEIDARSPEAAEQIEELTDHAAPMAREPLDTVDGQPDNSAVSNPAAKHAEAQESQPPGAGEKSDPSTNEDNDLPDEMTSADTANGEGPVDE